MLEVHNLFPRPVVTIQMDPLNSEEIEYIESLDDNLRKNVGNYTTNDHYILSNDQLSRFKDNIQVFVQEYFDNIICASAETIPYITQSWANFTYDGGYHYPHKHSNSIISGVFYVKCSDNDKISFTDYRQDTIELTPTSFNIYNSDSWWLPAIKNQLLLFPSSLRHSVPSITTDDSRISISFNVFVKGKLGTEQTLNELTL